MLVALYRRVAEQRGALITFSTLYAGKTSGIIVTFLFLPVYSRVLGSHQFGVVAIVLSLQALLTMMDLGMSTMVSREIALGKSSQQILSRLLRTAELCLSAFYGFIAVAASLAKYSGMLNAISWPELAGILVLLWALVLQNLYYSTMLARRDFVLASSLQLGGVITRALATTIVLAYFAPRLDAFIAVQLCFALLHMLATRYSCIRRSEQSFCLPTFRECMGLLRDGLPLVLFSAAGAAATQLDKPLISAFSSPESVTPYFLATTLCMAPISLLAGPVSQFFQPKLLGYVGQGRAMEARSTLKWFVLTTLVVTGVPAFGFWLLRDSVVSLWLGANADNAKVAEYVAILLPGFTIGALGFIPYSLLIAARDYRFQAAVSTLLTACTLFAAGIGAFVGSIEAVCWAYACYHTASTGVSWARAATLGTSAKLGQYSLALACRLIVAVLGFSVLITIIV